MAHQNQNNTGNQGPQAGNQGPHAGAGQWAAGENVGDISMKGDSPEK